MALFGWIALGVILLGLFLSVAFFQPKAGESKTREYLHHAAREIGFALMVAVATTFLFEIYERVREHEAAVERSFESSMADRMTPEVWREVRDFILEKTLLRRNADVSFGLAREPGLPAGKATMTLEFSYELENFADEPTDAPIEHELDYQFWYPERRLPRFERFVVEAPDPSQSRDLDERELLRVYPKGILKTSVRLPAKRSASAHVVTRRKEVVDVPGSYNLYVTEYTKGLMIRIDESLPGIDAEVRVRPEGAGLTLSRVGKTWRCGRLLLPGQGIEVKFADLARRKGH